jgi:hypothetical protein
VCVRVRARVCVCVGVWWGKPQREEGEAHLAVLLNTRSIGTSPLELPLVPAMYEPDARMLWIDRPMPPAVFEIIAHVLSVS